MAHLANSDADPERGVFLLPNGQPNMGHMLHSPSGSSTSERTNDTAVDVDETLSTSRDTESSTATPTKPLLISRTSHSHHHNGGGHNGVSNSKPAFKKSKHKVDKQNNHIPSCWKGREHWCCIVGSITFVLGALLLTVSLLLFMSSSKNIKGPSEPCVSAMRDTESSSSSPSNSLSQQQPVMVPETTSALPTTTFSYDGLVNIAAGLGEHAFQSSTYTEGNTTYSASASVDDSGNYTLSSGSCSLTDSQLQPFWWIDLQNYKLIKRIRIFKPTDCCHDSLVDAEVRIGQSEELSTNALCQPVSDPSHIDVVEVVCKRQIYGRYVSIQMLGTDTTYRSLALCEVQLYEH